MERVPAGWAGWRVTKRHKGTETQRETRETNKRERRKQRLRGVSFDSLEWGNEVDVGAAVLTKEWEREASLRPSIRRRSQRLGGMIDPGKLDR